MSRFKSLHCELFRLLTSLHLFLNFYESNEVPTPEGHCENQMIQEKLSHVKHYANISYLIAAVA